MASATPPSRPTIRTVAELAGVSKSLVSLVLRGSPHVSEGKRQAVDRAIAELGYRPNLMARNLTEGRTNLVGVVLNDLRNPWFIDGLEGLTAVLSARGMRVLLADGRLDQRTDDALLEAFLEMRVDGLVLLGTSPVSATLAEAVTTVPTVVAANRDVQFPRVDVVANDDRAGTELAVDHLVALGHTRIAHIAGAYGAVAAIRRDSYRDTMARHGLAVHEHIESADMTEDGGYRAAIRLLSSPSRPTAIFAVNDVTCVGAMSAAQELGLRVPQDVSLVGYDNTSLAQLRHLSLTSVDNANLEVGRRAGNALLARIDSPSAPATEVLLAPSLQVRNSTAAPSA